MYKASEPELNFPTFWCLVAQAWLSACVKAERHENLLASYLLYESQSYPACKCVHVSLVCVIHLTTSAFLWWGALVSGQSEAMTYMSPSLPSLSVTVLQSSLILTVRKCHVSYGCRGCAFKCQLPFIVVLQIHHRNCTHCYQVRNYH